MDKSPGYIWQRAISKILPISSTMHRLWSFSDFFSGLIISFLLGLRGVFQCQEWDISIESCRFQVSQHAASFHLLRLRKPNRDTLNNQSVTTGYPSTASWACKAHGFPSHDHYVKFDSQACSVKDCLWQGGRSPFQQFDAEHVSAQTIFYTRVQHREQWDKAAQCGSEEMRHELILELVCEKKKDNFALNF